MPEPKPTPGCAVCAACHRQWQQALDRLSPAYDRSHAVDLAEEIRRHPHPRAARAQGRADASAAPSRGAAGGGQPAVTQERERCTAIHDVPEDLVKSLKTTLGVDLSGMSVRCVIQEPHDGHEAPMPDVGGYFRWE
ncbi:hypothetical protein [Streptomyces sp. DW26H14]|uniref:hypothetical protein n=1 Tax=Streptomyces sp. DW26H14 TaxID=3435395 RepID=UPI00403DED87